MSEEELNHILCEFHNKCLAPILTGIDSKITSIDFRIERVRDEIKKEHEELLMRAVNAEAKLKLYEELFNKLNLNIEAKNESRESDRT